MTIRDEVVAEVAQLEPCVLCRHAATVHVLVEGVWILIGCSRPDCGCPAYGCRTAPEED